jgi:hypothetical protein
MNKLTRADLFTLERYAEERPRLRAQVLGHKQHRRLPLGPHLTLCFEDRLTVHYQIQEMLRVERIFDPEGIQAELDAYNPLIPDGHNLKATCLLEYEDAEERRVALARLLGIAGRIWLRVEGHEPVFAIADEDLDRETQEKTSSVHFLRFELTPAMCAALKKQAGLSAGVDHPEYRFSVEAVPDAIRAALARDLD